MIQKSLVLVLLTIGFASIAIAQTAPLKTYYSSEQKVGFRYPDSWRLSKENQSMDDEPGFTILTGVEPAATALRGQLRQASVKLAIGGTDEAECKAFNVSNINKDQETPLTKKVGKLTFYEISASDGAAGSVGLTNYYRTFHNGRCYELSFMIFRRNSRTDDRYVKAMDRQFNAILGSVYFK